MKDKQWFIDHVDTFVLRGSTEVFINNEATAEKLYELQDDKYQFSEKVRIHKAPMSTCLSCEG